MGTVRATLGRIREHKLPGSQRNKENCLTSISAQGTCRGRCSGNDRGTGPLPLLPVTTVLLFLSCVSQCLTAACPSLSAAGPREHRFHSSGELYQLGGAP